MDDSAGRGGWWARAAMLALGAATLAACAEIPRPEPEEQAASAGGTGRPYQVNGVWYYPKAQPDYDEIGIASWYGEQFQHRHTADGEVFDMNMPSAAHKTLPLPCLVEVTNLANGRQVIVRVNDRGPFIGGRVIDLSRAAATELGFLATGVTRVRVRYVGQADDAPVRAQPLARQYQVSAPRAPAPAPLAAPTTVAAPPVAPAAPMPAAAAPPEVYPAGAMPMPAPLITVASAAPDPAPAAPPSPIAAPPPAVPAPAASAQEPAPAATPKATDAAPPVAPAAAKPPAGKYQVQAGAFASAANAQRIATALATVGQTQVEPFEHSGRTLYRVVVRGLADTASAQTACSRARTLGVADARVMAATGA